MNYEDQQIHKVEDTDFINETVEIQMNSLF